MTQLNTHEVERVVVNAHEDTKNILEMNNIKPEILRTLGTCIQILFGHCGPKSQFAMLLNSTSAGMNFEPSLFTRDGIRILSAVEFMSPMERYIKELATYVGHRVDIAAKDGTTSSMLITLLFMKYFLQSEVDTDHLSTYEMDLFAKRVLDDVINTYISNYDATKLVAKYDTSDISEEAMIMKNAGRIAFMQAMSSSGGNVELAFAMKDIFRQSPKITWDFIESYTSRKETGHNYQVEVDAFDFKLQAVAATMVSMNKALNTEYHAENAKLIVNTSSLTDDSFITQRILDYLEVAKKDQPVVLLSEHFGGRITTMISAINKEREVPIVAWQFCPTRKLAGNAYPIELLILCATAGVTPAGMGEVLDFDESNIIDVDKIIWKDGYLFFHGLTELQEGTCVHPYLLDPEKAPAFYTETMDELRRQLQEHQEGHRPDSDMQGTLIEMINRLACIHRPILRLGGPVHEQIANREIAKDVQGAIMSSLSHGFTLNGLVHLLACIKRTIHHFNNEYDLNLLGCMSEAVTDVVRHLYPNDSNELSVLTQFDRDYVGEYMNVYSDTGNYLNYYLAHLDDILEMSYSEYLALDSDQHPTLKHVIEKEYPPVQPVMIVEELFKRIRELIMKFNNTNKIIVSGGVVVNK